jgi:CDP-glucose 4,6-dehydratase
MVNQFLGLIKTRLGADKMFGVENIPKNNIYKGKTVLITGHTGFKGSWLSIWLKALQANVIGYSLEPTTKPSLFEETNLEEKVTSIIADIRDENTLHETIEQYRPEFIFHLAAQAIVRTSYKRPKETYETNIMGLVNLFEVIRKVKSVRVLINVTSDKCYENKEWIWGYRENDPMGGYDPYSSSKGCAELITSAYRNSYFNQKNYHVHKTAISSVRAGNVIGGGDWAKDRIVPDCVRAIIDEIPIEIRNPFAIRPWQYVLEPLSGYLWLGVCLYHFGDKYSSAWNFAPKIDESIPVKTLGETIVSRWGDGKIIYSDDSENQPHESTYLRLDCSKANRLLKWYGIYTSREAINETVDWYKDFYIQKKKKFIAYLSIKSELIFKKPYQRTLYGLPI